MPLNTEILRDGEVRQIRWGQFHVAAMVYAASYDSGQGPFDDMESFKSEVEQLMETQGAIGINPIDSFNLAAYHVLAATPLNGGSYTIENATLVFQDNTDGEKFDIKPGDVLKAWRTSKF